MVKRLLIKLLALAVAVMAVLYFTNGNIVDSSTTDRAYGAVKVDANGKWYVINNSTHATKNIISVSQTDNYVMVKYSPTFTKIHYSAVTPDETLITQDYNVGASVGLNVTYVYIAKDGTKVNPNTVKSTSANFWFYVEGEY